MLRAASGFAALGLKPGDCAALLLRNDFAFLEASLAAVRLGAYAVPINWHFKADEVAYILADCGAKVLVAHADLLAGVARCHSGERAGAGGRDAAGDPVELRHRARSGAVPPGRGAIGRPGWRARSSGRARRCCSRRA